MTGGKKVPHFPFGKARWFMALLQNLERDGFQVGEKVLINSPDMTSFDPLKMKKNDHQSFLSIISSLCAKSSELLDEKHDHVVSVPFEQGLICERRKNLRDVERRRSLFRKL
jgi:hypothetical protein